MFTLARGARSLCFAFALCLIGKAQTPALSPAERAAQTARDAVAADPNNADAYNRLAMALARRARETSDVSKYDEAAAALAKSFELAPDNFEGQKVRAWLLLGKHEFAKALELAQQLNKRSADDAVVYGFLTDANTELGNYKEAEEAAQWMLDLSRASIPALTRAAYLRELFGDVDGAIELLASVYDRINPAESEDRAWTLTQLAHCFLLTGRVEQADQALDQALRLFPDYHYALANRAKVRTAQGKYAEAAELLQQRYRIAPHAENLFDLAVALEQAGRHPEASKAFADFEAEARGEMKSWDNANAQLISYYADHAHKPAEALSVASLEIARRHDVYTLDAYAWALHANGRDAEGRNSIEQALAVGVQDPKLLYHAGVICEALNDPAAAEQYFQKSLAANPHSDQADDARRLLIALSKAQ